MTPDNSEPRDEMSSKWSITIQNTNVDRFIADHGIDVYDIRTQPWLGADITWKHTDRGWEILLYPRMYYDGPADESILHALSTINRHRNPWFEETPAHEFNRFTKEFLNERRIVQPDAREHYSRLIVGIDSALCSSLDLFYLLSRGYLNARELRHLTYYRSEHFASHEGAAQFLASMAVMRVLGHHLIELYETFIKNKWYNLLPCLDRVEDCVRSARVVHADSIAMLDGMVPYLKEQTFLDTIAVLRRNVLGPRDDSEIDFDVAISYASEDRQMAEPLAAALLRDRLSVFYDQYMVAELWGKELHQHLTDVYRRRAKFCVIVVSASYARKLWPTVEREAAVARAVGQNRDYILPLRVDDTVVPGLPTTVVHIDSRIVPPNEVHEIIVRRVRLVN